MSDSNSFTSLSSIVDHIHDLAEDADSLHVNDILEMIGSRSFGPLMVVPALMAVIPFIGAIPGMTIITGLAIVAIACQILLGRSHVWVPKKVRQIPLDRSALKKGAGGFEGTAKFIDKFMTYRLALGHPRGGPVGHSARDGHPRRRHAADSAAALGSAGARHGRPHFGPWHHRARRARGGHRLAAGGRRCLRGL